MKVLKFGGTSVGSAERMKALAALIKSNEPKIVVLSAMSGTTNALVEIANSLYARDYVKAKKLIDALEKKYEGVLKELYSQKTSLNKGKELVRHHFEFIRSFTLDMFTANEEKAILAQGELLSTAMEHFYLEEIGIESVLLPALNFMRIDENEEPDMKYIEDNLKAELKKHQAPSNSPKGGEFGRGVRSTSPLREEGGPIFITQGYICRNAFGEIDNLKRGGSDYTATLIGAALSCDEIQIWTDIDGMHNNDPRIVEKTFPVTELSFDEAAELAYFGAKILHPACVLPAQKRKVPVRLLNTMQPEAKGTVITEKTSTDRITAVAAKDGITAIKIKSARMLLAYGFLRSVFEIFERHKTSIDMITTSEVAVSVTIDNDSKLSAIVKELKEFCSVEIDKDQAIVCVVGNFSAEKQGVAAKILGALKNIPLRMISYGGSDNNVSVLIDSKYKKDALVALNKGLFNL